MNKKIINKNKNFFNSKKLLIAVALILTLCIGGIIGYTISRKKFTDLSLSTNNTACDQQGKIAYKNFSPGNAEIFFEYPAKWTYKEIQDAFIPSMSRWIFYADTEQTDENRIMEMGNLTETVGFLSSANRLGGETGVKLPYWVRTYPTNDANTFITQENVDSGNKHSGYIYWQKGKYFPNSETLDKKYDGATHIISYYNSFLPDKEQPARKDFEKAYEISQHIAKSIRIR